MAEFERTDNNQIPYQQHPLYREAMERLADGDAAAAADSLDLLASSYPDEQAVHDLLLRTQLRTAFGTEQQIPAERTPAAPGLRNVVLFMLAITACLVVLTAGTAVWQSIGIEGQKEEERAVYIQSIWDDVIWRIDRLDLNGAREGLTVLSIETPEDPKVQEMLALLDQRQAEADKIADAALYKERGDWQQARDLLIQIPPESPYFDHAQRMLREMKEPADLEAAWQDAQAMYADEDWQGVISNLNWLRSEDLEFQRISVEEQLYQANARLARDLISSAGGNTEPLLAADSYLGAALRLRPTDAELIAESKLIKDYVAGAEALTRGDWAGVVVRWEPVEESQPDYQGGELKRRLDDAYPLAARQLIAQSSGSEMVLVQALEFMDKAIVLQPEDEALREDRRLILEYLDGLDAFRLEDWDLAIAYWGPIYAANPGYLNETLEEKLRVACTSSESPNETYCLP